MTDVIETDRQNILTIQKELMSAILDYQIRHGSGTVSWNVNVQFIDAPVKLTFEKKE